MVTEVGARRQWLSVFVAATLCAGSGCASPTGDTRGSGSDAPAASRRGAEMKRASVPCSTKTWKKLKGSSQGMNNF